MASDRSARIIAGGFVAVGVTHFVKPGFFEAVVPRWFPDPALANKVSGGAEIGLGLAMIPRRTRPAAALGLLGLLVAVFPANVDMYLNDVEVASGPDGIVRREGVEAVRVRNLIRLPFQFVFGWFVWQHTTRGRYRSQRAPVENGSVL